MILRSLVLTFLAVATPAAADDLQGRVLAGARAVSPEAIAFTRTTRVEQRQGTGAPEVHSQVDRWDPSRPVPQRWTLISIDGRTPTSDEIVNAATRYADAPVPSYGRLARWLGAKAMCDARTCRYAALPHGVFMFNGRDLSADTAAEAIVGDGPVPWVVRTHFVSTKGFRMMLVAHVDRVEASQTFRLLPGGIPAPAESVIEMTGAMMGKSGSIRTVTTYSDVKAAAPSTH